MMNVFQKLQYVQMNLHAPKGQRNNFGNYNYRSCEDILEAAKPILNKVGAVIVVSDNLIEKEGRYYIRAEATFYDVEGDRFITASGYAREEESKKGMDGSQVTGASSSYARKYALNGLLLIDDNKDSDSTCKHGKDDLNYEVNSGEVGKDGSGKEPQKSKPLETVSKVPDMVKTPPPAPAPAPVKNPGDDTLLTQKTIDVILLNFDGLGIEVWDLEKQFGKTSEWTIETRRKILRIFEAIKGEISYSTKDFLEGRLPKE